MRWRLVHRFPNMKGNVAKNIFLSCRWVDFDPTILKQRWSDKFWRWRGEDMWSLRVQCAPRSYTKMKGERGCSHLHLCQMLNYNTKQTACKQAWDALERARLQDFKCPRWRAELQLVQAPSYIRTWLPPLSTRVLDEYGQIFHTRPNLIRPWASRMKHIYGAITHQFDSIYSVEGRNGSRLLVYQDREVKQLNVFWPLFYYGPGPDQDQEYVMKLAYLESRWASLSPSYAAPGGESQSKPKIHYAFSARQDPCICSCHTDGFCECHCHKQRPCNCGHYSCGAGLGPCGCHCHNSSLCPCISHRQQQCKCLCHQHEAHCGKVRRCKCECHKNVVLEQGWSNDFMKL